MERLKVFKKSIKHIILLLCFTNASLAGNVSKQEEARKFYNEGIKLSTEKKYEDSISAFNKAIGLYPKFMKAYYAKSNIFAILNNHDLVIKTCDDALSLNNKQPRILAQKAFALYTLKRYQDSFNTAKLSVKYGEKLPISYIARANAYATLGNFELAVMDYDKALSLVNNSNHSSLDETYLNRFCPLYKLKRYDEALATCNKALEVTDNPNKLPQIYSKKALVLNQLDKHEEALENAKKALKIDAKDPLGISEKKTAESKLKNGFF